jgi:hypothetical protein
MQVDIQGVSITVQEQPRGDYIVVLPLLSARASEIVTQLGVVTSKRSLPSASSIAPRAATCRPPCANSHYSWTSPMCKRDVVVLGASGPGSSGPWPSSRRTCCRICPSNPLSDRRVGRGIGDGERQD